MRAVKFTGEDLDDLSYARELLEQPGVGARVAALLGVPIEKGLEMLPARWSEIVNQAAEASIRRAFGIAVMTLQDRPRLPSSETFHKLAAAATGAAGGGFGLGALAIELPVSTGVMLRSVADIARSEGERIRTVEAGLACLEVFALGGRATDDDATETGYYAARAALAAAVSEAARHIAEKGLAGEGAPAIIRLISSIAGRFSVVVSEKVAAQAVPVIGAVGGAIVNGVFIDHFQTVARGHFIVRRLERKYGSGEVARMYREM